jgi:hypothetical protein
MKGEDRMHKVQEGYQPRKDELTRGYQVKQSVDSKQISIPKNLADAAVTPANIADSAPTPAKTEKQ